MGTPQRSRRGNCLRFAMGWLVLGVGSDDGHDRGVWVAGLSVLLSLDSRSVNADLLTYISCGFDVL
jgi:hypothetical protein